MPLGFFHGVADVDLIPIWTDRVEQDNLLRYINRRAQENGTASDEKYAFSLRMDVTLRKSHASVNPCEIRVTTDPKAMPVQLTDIDVIKHFPYTPSPLLKILKKRYADFHYKRFEAELDKLKSDSLICFQRLYNPDRAKSGAQYRFASRVIEHFDKMFTPKKLNSMTTLY